MLRSEFNTAINYDIIITGGGITGAAVAYDAASRGFTVALAEKDDFGSKTSSATSKLIHGGLRYLANYEFSVVRESLKERRILENIAPNFVYPLPDMMLINNPGMRKKRYFFKAGMILYDILSADKKFTWDRSKKLPCHRNLSRKETVENEPVLDSKDLSGAFLYYDCINICPERLTLAFVKSAQSKGADVANYMEVTGFMVSNGAVCGVVLKDKIRNRAVSVRGNLVINCGGPWADSILSIAGIKNTHENLRRSEGIHIISKKITDRFFVAAMTPEGKHVFIIPWRGHSLIGTTDMEYYGSPDDWKIKKESILELIKDVNLSFGEKIKLKYEDVLFCYGGLRPLVESKNPDVYESSRKYEIFDNCVDGFNCLITVEGGKYTTSRSLAEKVMKLACKKLGIPGRKSRTDREFLYGCEIEDMESFAVYCKKKYNKYNENVIDYLARIYGTEIDGLMSIAARDSSLSVPVTGEGEIGAQVVYAVQNEMAYKLTDVIFRRTGMGTLGHPGKKALNKIAGIAAGLLDWDITRKNREIEEAEKIFSKP